MFLPNKLAFHRVQRLPWGWMALAVCLSGCEPESLGFTEVKRVHEAVTAKEWASFVRIVDRLPERRVPSFPPVFQPVPQWDAKRSARVHDLYLEDLKSREDGWNTELIKPSFARHKLLDRELRKEKMTPEQFAGLVLTLGAALCRIDVPDGVDLPKLSERARPLLSDLDGDQNPFHSLTPETQHSVLQKAMWIARKVRADKLKQVPRENQALAKRHAEWLRQALPGEFAQNPIEEIQDLLEERGLPFEELPEVGSDEDLLWPHAGGAAPRR